MEKLEAPGPGGNWRPDGCSHLSKVAGETAGLHLHLSPGRGPVSQELFETVQEIQRLLNWRLNDFKACLQPQIETWFNPTVSSICQENSMISVTMQQNIRNMGCFVSDLYECRRLRWWAARLRKTSTWVHPAGLQWIGFNSVHYWCWVLQDGMLVFYGFLLVLSWKQLAGLRVNLDATRHLLDACRTRGKAFVVLCGCPGFCVSDISYLEGKQSCACWPTFDEYNASKRSTFYVCLLLFSSQICLKHLFETLC